MLCRMPVRVGGSELSVVRCRLFGSEASQWGGPRNPSEGNGYVDGENCPAGPCER